MCKYYFGKFENHSYQQYYLIFVKIKLPIHVHTYLQVYMRYFQIFSFRYLIKFIALKMCYVGTNAACNLQSN